MKGDIVVDGHFWNHAPHPSDHCYSLDTATTASIPPHMLLCVEGFKMDVAAAVAAPKPRSGKKRRRKKKAAVALAPVMRIPDAAFEAICRELPSNEEADESESDDDDDE